MSGWNPTGCPPDARVEKGSDMSDKLDLSLPETPTPKERPQHSRNGLLWLVLLLQIGLGVFFYLRMQTPRTVAGPALTVEQQRDLAMKLEKQGLADAAAEVWQEYLTTRDADTEKAAKIWYRIGKAYQDAGKYEQALEAFYRSESFMTVDSLSDEISRRTQECLESLGKYAALRYELAERVGIGEQSVNPGEEVVAEIGPTKITKADLDRLIEAAVGRQLAQYAAFVPEEQLKQQKESLLKRFSSNEQRQQILSQFVTEEILVRKAREDGLIDTPAVRDTLRDAERSILAQQLLQQEVTAKITVTPGDVEMYYKASPGDFMDPEKVRIAHILVSDEDKAKAVLNSLSAGKKFEELAKEVSDDTATADKGGVIEAWLTRDRQSVPGIGEAPDLVALAFETPVGEVAAKAVTTANGCHVIKVVEHTEARQKTLDEVRDEAARRLRTRREREAQEALIKSLFDKYNVVVHQAQFGKEHADDGAATTPAP